MVPNRAKHHIWYNVLSNERDLKIVYQQNFPKNRHVFFRSKCFHRVSLMHGNFSRVKMGGWYMAFWKHQKIWFSIIFQVKSIRFFNFLLNQRYMLFVNVVCEFFNCYWFLNLIINLKDWPLVLSAWPCWWISC